MAEQNGETVGEIDLTPIDGTIRDHLTKPDMDMAQNAAGVILERPKTGGPWQIAEEPESVGGRRQRRSQKKGGRKSKKCYGGKKSKKQQKGGKRKSQKSPNRGGKKQQKQQKQDPM
jgi:hypothetical protein